jgi:hypothetical protein
MSAFEQNQIVQLTSLGTDKTAEARESDKTAEARKSEFRKGSQFSLLFHGEFQEVAQNIRRHLEVLKKRKGRLILPNSQTAMYMDGLMAILLVFTATITPFKVCFMKPNGLDGMFFLNRLVDIGFVIGIVAQFFLAFRDPDGNLVGAHKLLFQRYMYGWFTFDIVTALLPIPFEFISALNESAISGKARAIRITRTIRIIKLFRIFRASHIYMHTQALGIEGRALFQRYGALVQPGRPHDVGALGRLLLVFSTRDRKSRKCTNLGVAQRSGRSLDRADLCQCVVQLCQHNVWWH